MQSPATTVNQLADAINHADDSFAMKAKLQSEAQEIVEAGEIALYVSRWRLSGVDVDGRPISMAGESSDILRRQKDGRWLVTLDNPWGALILPK